MADFLRVRGTRRSQFSEEEESKWRTIWSNMKHYWGSATEAAEACLDMEDGAFFGVDWRTDFLLIFTQAPSIRNAILPYSQLGSGNVVFVNFGTLMNPIFFCSSNLGKSISTQIQSRRVAGGRTWGLAWWKQR